MITKVKELRVEIDGISQLVKELQPVTGVITIGDYKTDVKCNTNELNKSYDSLILAKAWLGKVLEVLGADNPYKNDYKTKEDIVATADTNTDIVKDWDEQYINLNHIEKVVWLRECIKYIIDKIVELTIDNPTREFSIARTNCYNHLSEARFWLGFELQRYKESK